MKDEARDSLGEFQSSIFDASDGHQLVDFIRKKKGLRSQPLKIFDDVQPDRQSLQIEVQRLDDEEDNMLQPVPEAQTDPSPVKLVKDNAQSTSVHNNIPNRTRRTPHKSPAYADAKLKWKRLSHSIGRRTLLKEFEKTLQESRFLPATCSTPLSQDSPNAPVSPPVSVGEKSNANQRESVNLHMVCSPITITDTDSPPSETPPPKNQSVSNKTLASNDNTEDVMRDLHEQNDMLLAMEDELHDADNAIVNENEYLSSKARDPNRTTNNAEQLRAFTIQHRDSTSGKLLSSPDKSRRPNAREPPSPQTPAKSIRNNVTRLIVTPQQKRLLLSRFSGNSALANSPQKPAAASVQKASRIPLILRGATITQRNTPAATTCHQETAQIIEQLQKGNPTNAPMVVIPVNQTFNQAPVEKASSIAVEKAPSKNISNASSNEITSTTTTPLPQPKPIESNNSSDERIPLQSLRLEDIITEDEDSSSADEPPKMQSRRQKRQSKCSTLKRHEKNLSLTRNAPQSRAATCNVRQIISSQELSQLSTHEILDLRKRNSRGELQRNFQLTKQECNMFEKQVELEILRRSVQENDYEDEILQMEVLPAPPEEFSDTRKSSRLNPQLPTDCLVETDLIDERSSDRISLSQRKQQQVANKPIAARKGGRREKKVLSRQLEKYLEASTIVSHSKSKYLNLSKRKLYNKGNSDGSSDDFSPRKSYRRILNPANTSKKRSTSYREAAALIEDKSRRTVVSSRNSDPSSQPSTPLHLSPPAEFASTSRRSPCHRRISPQHCESPRQRSSRLSSPQISSPVRPSTVRHNAQRTSPQSHISPRYSSPPRSSGFQSLPLPSPPAGFASESEARIQFLPNDNHIFKKPKGRPPKKKVAKQKPKPQSPSHPVDPDLVASSTNDETSTVRRSSREKKPLSVYWSCTKTEFRPLYDLSILAQKKNSSVWPRANASKNTQNLPTSDNNLVANTKTVRSNSVEKPQKAKKLTRKQQNEQEPLRAKKAPQSKSDTSSLSSHCPSFHSSVSTSESHQARIQVKALASISNDPEVTILLNDSKESTTERATDPSSAAKSKGHFKTKKRTSKSEQATPSIDSQSTTTSECSERALRGQQLPTITEDLESDTNHPDSMAELKKSSKSNLKRPQTSAARKSGETPKSKGRRSKRLQLSSKNSSNSSDCPSEDYSSSIQQVRLATIAEDSIPEPVCEVTVAASEKGALNDRTKRQPVLAAPRTSSNPNKSKRTKKDKFRTEHDESIADVSTVYVNNLFDQLKCSSMCGATDVTPAQQVSCNGQVSRISRAKDQRTTAAAPKCKNFTVRLLRMKNKKQSPKGDDKVCDSGFSSEDMPSVPRQKSGASGDLLLNWLKDILGNSPSSSEKGVARFLQADGFHAASVDDLIFQELNGVDYAFYNTKERCSFGYMRFKPKTQKKNSIAKLYELNLFVLCGTLRITVNKNGIDCKSGDLITVFIGTTYGINNTSNDPALVMVIKK